MSRRAHVCPPWCHPCRRMKGDIMPMCAGSAQPGIVDLSRCTCDRRTTWVTRLKDAEEALAAIRKRAHEERQEMEARLADLKQRQERLEAFVQKRMGYVPFNPVKRRAPVVAFVKPDAAPTLPGKEE